MALTSRKRHAREVKLARRTQRRIGRGVGRVGDAAAERLRVEQLQAWHLEAVGEQSPATARYDGIDEQSVREAKAALEQEAKEKAAQQRAEAEQKLAEREEEERCTGKKKGGRKSEPPDPDKARPDDAAQRNFTDPESRIMPDGANKGSFVQGYNAQIAVDSASQVIVAAEVTQETNDKKQLLPMIALIAANLEQKPEKVSADTGYFSEANVTDEQVKDVDLYVATGRDKHGVAVETSSDPPPPGASPK